ncbi:MULTISPECIES: hypothetical protein [unclassified Bradyrhizobium]|uniref:hypothetical protein n=1 Tax=unclassified Bradyrhizobium TaxID=2631580 RepID=UPI001CD2883C|nr:MULTISPECIES: hypothetical protein [unclassified Bradyrhizobium]MCA1379060.1 hypothetical protein [Bradyrhizobium sp. IC4060]MCA1489157.1 hypothetical protein [Bradyrhizobium sp. IC4061]
MNKDPPLTPDDFPIEVHREKLKNQKGEPVASAETEQLAGDVAERLNEQAYQEEQDRWSA